VEQREISIQVSISPSGDYQVAICGGDQSQSEIGSSVEEAVINFINAHRDAFDLKEGELIEPTAVVEGHRLGSREALNRTISVLAHRAIVVKTHFSSIQPIRP
jgi:hypothetical protein